MMIGKIGFPACFPVLAIALLLTGGCTAEPLGLRTPWQDGELAVYEISRDGKILMVEQFSLRHDQGRLLFSSEYISDVSPVVKKVFMDPVTLIPERTEIEIMHEGAMTRVMTAEYGEGEVQIRRMTGDGEFEDKVMKLPEPPYYENEQFMALVRALPLEEEWSGIITLIVSSQFNRADIELEVTGRETVTVPAGTFDAYVVELGRIGQRAWVAVDPPHPVVRYQNDAANTITELVEFYPEGN